MIIQDSSCFSIVSLRFTKIHHFIPMDVKNGYSLVFPSGLQLHKSVGMGPVCEHMNMNVLYFSIMLVEEMDKSNP